MKRQLAILPLLVLAACAAAPMAERAAPEEGGADDLGFGRSVAEREPAGDTAPSDPYTRRAGGPGEGGPEEPPEVAFLAPARHEGPVPAAERPAFPGEAALAVVVVEEGLLAPRPDLLLDLEGHLDGQRFSRVAALRLPPEPESAADLPRLAAWAAAAEHDLLLVVDASAAERRRWQAWLVDAATGRLVDRFTGETAPAEPSAARDDPWALVALAFRAACGG